MLGLTTAVVCSCAIGLTLFVLLIRPYRTLWGAVAAQDKYSVLPAPHPTPHRRQPPAGSVGRPWRHRKPATIGVQQWRPVGTAASPTAIPSNHTAVTVSLAAEATGTSAGGHTIIWYRVGDLRMDDQVALHEAAARGVPMLPVFCFDPTTFSPELTRYGTKKMGHHRAQFLLEGIDELKQSLRATGSDLMIVVGKPEQVIPALCTASDGPTHVIGTARATVEERAQEKTLLSALEAFSAAEPASQSHYLQLLYQNTLYHPDDLPMEPKDTPDTFTLWRQAVEKANTNVRPPLPPPGSLPSLWPDTSLEKARVAFLSVSSSRSSSVADVEADKASEAWIGLSDMPNDMIHRLGLGPTLESDTDAESLPQLGGVMEDTEDGRFVGGESAAQRRLKQWMWDGDNLKTYFDTRNGTLGNKGVHTPIFRYSSKLSPWLAAGFISPRRVHAEVIEYERQRVKNKSTYWLIFELMWRDYYQIMAAKHGHYIFSPKGPKGKNMQLASDVTDLNDLERWKTGMTGVPFVDAAMRELSATGFMGNRLRQNVASFLVLDMGCDWRDGAAHFEEQLIDYDCAANWGNWCAAAGGFGGRLNHFNIAKQGKDYDPDGAYVKTWCPELDQLPAANVHNPGSLDETRLRRHGVTLGVNYPRPVALQSRGGRGRGNGAGRGGGRGGRGRGGSARRGQHKGNRAVPKLFPLASAHPQRRCENVHVQAASVVGRSAMPWTEASRKPVALPSLHRTSLAADSMPRRVCETSKLRAMWGLWDGAEVKSVGDNVPGTDELKSKVWEAMSSEQRHDFEMEDQDDGSGPFTVRASRRRFPAGNGDGKVRVVLYRDTAAWCPYCHKVVLQLEEKGIPYDVRKVNMRCYGDKPAWFRTQVSASGLLPAIEIDGQVVTESDVIMATLERTFPEHRPLLPATLVEEDPNPMYMRAQELMRLERQLFRAWLSWLTSSGRDASRNQTLQANFETVLDRVNAELGNAPDSGPFFFGSDVSLVDITFVTFVERMVASLLYYKGLKMRRTKRWANVEEWLQAWEQKPAYVGMMSDYYTHCQALPPQIGGCGLLPDPEVQALAAQIDGKGTWWKLDGLRREGEERVVQKPGSHDDEEHEARLEAAYRILIGMDKVTLFASRGAALPGFPPVMAELADPNNLGNKKMVPKIEVALRCVALALVSGCEAALPVLQGSDVATSDLVDALAYLRDRIGVPRDMSHAAARQLRAYINWAIDYMPN